MNKFIAIIGRHTAIAAMLFVLVRPLAATTFTVGDSDFLLNGKPFQIKAGEMHPARVPHQYWADRLWMIHAMGLNTVSIYVFWNVHEPREGEFNFSGDADVAEFVRLAQKEGLWVILRPGPYCCAEWEFGGFPWWLLKDHDMKVRSQDPRFLAVAATYMKKLGEQLAPLQITHGGPIIMVQVENEYGSYDADHVYMGKIRDMDRAAGFDVPFFTADGGGQMMANGHLPGVLPGLNGGSGPDIMKQIGKYRPTGPWLVPEFYPGWLDHWGEPHAKVGLGGLARETAWKLTNNVSFCYYMIYGGTSFGFMNGANYGGNFQPQPTSYDYNSPMDEMGRPTEKYFALRDVLKKYLTPGETLPDVPGTTPVIEISQIEFTASASIFDLLGQPVKSEKPLSFEDLDQGYGYVLYRTKISGPAGATLKINKLRDYAVVCVDGKRIATLDRRDRQDSVVLTNAGRDAGHFGRERRSHQLRAATHQQPQRHHRIRHARRQRTDWLGNVQAAVRQNAEAEIVQPRGHCAPLSRAARLSCRKLATRLWICAAGAKALSLSTATISDGIGILGRSRRSIVLASGSKKAVMRL